MRRLERIGAHLAAPARRTSDDPARSNSATSHLSAAKISSTSPTPSRFHQPGVSPYGIRQFVVIAEDLALAVREFKNELELPDFKFKDPHIHVFGIEHEVFPVGDTFFEIVSPYDRDSAAFKQLRRRGGDGGYMFMLEMSPGEDFDAKVKQLTAVDGFTVVFNHDGKEMREVHLHPKDTSTCIVSVSQPIPFGSWHWAGPDWAHQSREASTKKSLGFRGVVLQAKNVEKTRAAFEKLLRTSCDRDGTFRLQNDQTVQIVRLPEGDTRGDGLAGFRVRATKRNDVGKRRIIGGVFLEYV